MERSRIVKALVISQRDTGASNREATFLCDRDGLLRATVWGGPKSALRSRVSPWHLGTLYLYHDPVRNSTKVTDFDVVNQFLGLRETLDRSWAASAISEVLLASPGAASGADNDGEGHLEALALAIDSLEGLEGASDSACRPLFLRWLWRSLSLMGLAVDLAYCDHCSCPLGTDEVVWYAEREGCVVCEACRGRGMEADTLLRPLSIGLRRWLASASSRAAVLQSRTSLDRALLAEAANFLCPAAENALGRGLSVWHSWPS